MVEKRKSYIHVDVTDNLTLVLVWLSVILKIQNLQKELEVGGSWLKSDIAQKSSADTSWVLSDERYQGEERIAAGADRGEGEVA